VKARPLRLASETNPTATAVGLGDSPAHRQTHRIRCGGRGLAGGGTPGRRENPFLFFPPGFQSGRLSQDDTLKTPLDWSGVQDLSVTCPPSGREFQGRFEQVSRNLALYAPLVSAKTSGSRREQSARSAQVPAHPEFFRSSSRASAAN